MVMSAIAGVVNYLCLRLLQRLKDPDVNLRAATTFSFNEFISNGGILIAGVLVLWLGTNWPDLLVGFATAIIALKAEIGRASCRVRVRKYVLILVVAVSLTKQ